MIAADAETWRRIAEDPRGAMGAFRQRRLRMRGSLHVGVGFLAATAGSRDPGRLAFDRILDAPRAALDRLRRHRRPRRSCACTGSAAPRRRSYPRWRRSRGRSCASWRSTCLASASPTSRSARPYDAPWFARATFEAMDALGSSPLTSPATAWAGGSRSRPGLLDRSRVSSLSLLCPALAWLRDRRWAPIVRLLRPELGLLQMAPRQCRRADDAPARADRERRLGGRGRRRVPAGVPDAARTRRLLRRGAQHLSRRAAWRGGLLERASRRSRPTRSSSGASATRSSRSPSCGMSSGRCPRRGTSSSTAGTCRSSSARARRTAPSCSSLRARSGTTAG